MDYNAICDINKKRKQVMYMQKIYNDYFVCEEKRIGM